MHAFPLDLPGAGPHWVKAVHADQLNQASGAANCPCPMCRAARPTFFAYGFIIACVRIKKLQQRVVPMTRRTAHAGVSRYSGSSLRRQYQPTPKYAAAANA